MGRCNCRRWGDVVVAQHRVYTTGITVVLDCAANGGERTAIAQLFSQITAAKLTLPGDPARRPLTFRAQPFDR